MSRIGNKVITLAEGVTVDVQADNFVTVKGPKGEISAQLCKEMTIEVEGANVKIVRPSDSIRHKALHGTTRALLNNMVYGVTNLFTKALVMEGVGYRAASKDGKLTINAGYSHLVELVIPEGVKVETPSATEIVLSGVNKQVIGQFASEIRAVRKPEPYLGKGIRYKDEIIRRKEGKKAK